MPPFALYEKSPFSEDLGLQWGPLGPDKVEMDFFKILDGLDDTLPTTSHWLYLMCRK